MDRSDLTGPAPSVAPRLLGMHLTREAPEGAVTVEITEVEAYAGENDPASHTHRGLTARNQVMFGEPGHLYVYLSYGIHWCANIVTGPAGQGSGILLRAGRVVVGIDLARERRGAGTADRSLARGPGCVAQSLGIDMSLSAADVFAGTPLALRPGRSLSPTDIAAGPRVGVRLAADEPWRFWIAGDPTVSAYKRNPRAVPPSP